MPVTMHRDYMHSYTPSYEVIPLGEAFRRVVSGRLGAKLVFDQLPKQVKDFIEDTCRSSLGKGFGYLARDEQKAIFVPLLIALENAERSTKPPAATTNRPTATAVRPTATAVSQTATAVSQTATVVRQTPRPAARKWWQFWR
jgi:hypothetical protein